MQSLLFITEELIRAEDRGTMLLNTTVFPTISYVP